MTWCSTCSFTITLGCTLDQEGNWSVIHLCSINEDHILAHSRLSLNLLVTYHHGEISLEDTVYCSQLQWFPRWVMHSLIWYQSSWPEYEWEVKLFSKRFRGLLAVRHLQETHFRTERPLVLGTCATESRETMWKTSRGKAFLCVWRVGQGGVILELTHLKMIWIQMVNIINFHDNLWVCYDWCLWEFDAIALQRRTGQMSSKSL